MNYEALKEELKLLIDGERELSHNVALEDTCHREGIQNTDVIRADDIEPMLWTWFEQKLNSAVEEAEKAGRILENEYWQSQIPNGKGLLGVTFNLDHFGDRIY